MALTVEMQNTGDPGLQREVAATIEHALADRSGDWLVSIVMEPLIGPAFNAFPIKLTVTW